MRGHMTINPSLVREIPHSRAATASLRVVDRNEPACALRRLESLLDRGSLNPLVPASADVAAATGRVRGACVSVFACNPERGAGALGPDGCRGIVAAIERGVAEGCPVIGVWHSAGARLQDGAASLDAIGRVFAAIVAASGRVPQISLVLGPAAGGAAYGPALGDFVIMGPAGRVFVTGPEVVRAVTGEAVDALALGGPDVHLRSSGLAHLAAASEDVAISLTCDLVQLLASPGELAPPHQLPPEPRFETALPSSSRRAYSVYPIIDLLLDNESPVVELHSRWARNVVTVLGRLGGLTVGIVASNPLHRGGCLDVQSSEKAARFVRTCDAFGVPLVVLADVPGYLPGRAQEWEGVVRRGAKLLHAFAEAVVPRVTVVTRKAYGGAFIAMNSRSLGATSVLAWPSAEIGVMSPSAAVGLLHRRRLAAVGDKDRPALADQLAVDYARTSGGLQRAVELGIIDAVIAPSETRREIAKVLATIPSRYGGHGNIPL
jgi:acetyl-CoA/propionyl-CoA carboxylase carboxyl transferase subunit